jgi:hypothetical protein
VVPRFFLSQESGSAAGKTATFSAAQRLPKALRFPQQIVEKIG